MKYLLTISALAFALLTGYAATPENDNKFEFAKPVYKIKATIKKADGEYILIPRR